MCGVTTAVATDSTGMPRVNEVPADLDNHVERNASGKPGLTPEMLLRLSGDQGGKSAESSRYGVEWFPDGRRLLISMPYWVGSELRSGVFVIDVGTKERSFIADGSIARLAPDGARIAFLVPGGRMAIATLSAHRSGSVMHWQISKADAQETEVSEIAWSPDSRMVAYLGRYATNTRDAAIEGVQSLIASYDVTTGATHVLYRGHEGVEGITWAKRGVFFARGEAHAGDGDDWRFWGEVSLLRPETGRIRRVINMSGFRSRFLAPSVSPDERWLAYGHDPFQIAPVALFMVPAIHNLTSGETTIYPFANNFALMEAGPRWRRGSSEAVYRCKVEAVFSSFCIVDISSRTMRRVDMETLRSIDAFAVSPTDGRLAWLNSDPFETMRLEISGRDLRAAQVIYSVAKLRLPDVGFGEIRPISWATKDGLHFGGALVLPVNYVPGRLYPLVVDVHGGPSRYHLRGSLLNQSPLEWQMWAAKGYAVFVADYRKGGVAGLNEEYHRRMDGYEEDGDLNDVQAGIDQVVRMGIADPHRVGAVGHSYGAIVLDWFVTHSHELRAAIVSEGFPALWDGDPKAHTSQFGHQLLPYRRWLMGTDEVHRGQVERLNAPLTYANQVSTPVLWVSGGNDHAGVINVPRVYVDSINDGGGCARLIEFPNEDHVFVDSNNVRELLASAVSWFGYWLSARTGSTSARGVAEATDCKVWTESASAVN
jgi:dienelactone hydrolase